MSSWKFYEFMGDEIVLKADVFERWTVCSLSKETRGVRVGEMSSLILIVDRLWQHRTSGKRWLDVEVPKKEGNKGETVREEGRR